MVKFNFLNINSANSTKAFFLKNKKVVIPALIVVLVIIFFIFHSKKSNNTNIEQVKYGDLSRSVRATGQVISNTNLDLSFNKVGVIKSVRVKVGDTVKAGQILATLDGGQAGASLTEARARLLGAQAKYNKILEGASNEEVALAEVTLKNSQTDLANTKKNQANLVANAYAALLNSSLVATAVSSSDTQTPPTISGTYVKGLEGDIKIAVSQSGTFNTSGLFNYSVDISKNTPQPIGDTGLYIIFPSSFNYQGEWVISIPNKKSSSYLTNYNIYKSALQTEESTVSTAESLVAQRQAELNLKKASARSTDLDIARSEVLSAQGSLQSAQSSYEDTIIRAPAGGTITKVDIKYGELGEAGKAVITLEDVNNLYIEALINEANIAYLKLGQSVSITFDAFGSDKKFTGTIVEIDPSAETNAGVVNYKIKVSINEDSLIIRPGMNANIDVLAGGVQNVLAVSNIAVNKKDGKSFVNVVTDEKKNKYVEREVSTGFVGDNNMVEIVSGLTVNDKIVLILK